LGELIPEKNARIKRAKSRCHVRAAIAKGVSSSNYTSVKYRNEKIRADIAVAAHAIAPVAGIKSTNVPAMTEADYIELVDFTGREMHLGKRGKIADNEPKALTRLGLDKNHWTMRVKGIGSGYWRVVGELEELVEKAAEFKQRTLFGIGFATLLKNS
jgi:hypothetical protein